MKKFFAILTIIFSLANPIFAFGDFDSAVEDAHKDSKKETPKKSPKKPSSSTDSSKSSYDNDGSTSELIVTILEAIPMIWLINASAKYSPYPYSTDECNYLKYESSSDQLRKYRLSLDSSYTYLKELGYGNTSSVDCMLYPLIGFYAENTVLFDSENENSKDHMGNIRVTGQTPLFQTDPLSLYIRAGWGRWYGETTPYLKSNGFIFGVELKSYIIKPISLRFKADWQSFSENISIFDCDAQAGIILKRLEVFGGYKYMEVKNSETERKTGEWKGFSSGLRLHL